MKKLKNIVHRGRWFDPLLIRLNLPKIEEYRAGKRQVLKISFYFGTVVYGEGFYFKGEKHGYYRTFDFCTGCLSSEGNYKNGLLHGKEKNIILMVNYYVRVIGLMVKKNFYKK